MFCQFCGAPLRTTARYCKHCGGRVDEPVEAEPDDSAPASPLAAPPASEEDAAPRPWRQNEDAIILPITRELPRPAIPEPDAGGESEVIPISQARMPMVVDSPVPLDLPRQPLQQTDDWKSGDGPVRPDRRTDSLAIGIPLLLLAVLLLFVLAFLAVR
jgi:hypothetical protein